MQTTVLSRLKKIEQAIALIYTDANCDQSLKRLIEQESPSLNTLVALNHNNHTARIIAFAHHYINQAPKMLGVLDTLAKSSAINEYTQAFLTTAADYFFTADPAVIDHLSGTHAYLSRAYLCHRMLEELNDRVRTERQWPLAPIDTTYTNLITHTLIGDKTANLLDQRLLIDLELINTALTSAEKNIFHQQPAQQSLALLYKEGWGKTLQRWPFLAEDMAALLQ